MTRILRDPRLARILTAVAVQTCLVEMASITARYLLASRSKSGNSSGGAKLFLLIFVKTTRVRVLLGQESFLVTATRQATIMPVEGCCSPYRSNTGSNNSRRAFFSNSNSSSGNTTFGGSADNKPNAPKRTLQVKRTVRRR